MIAGVLIAAAGTAAWFLRRARLGARVRTLAGIRLRLAERASTAVNRSLAARATLGCLAGSVLAGTGGAIAGTVAAVASCRLASARARRGTGRATDEQIPDVMRGIAAAVRAGRSVPQAIGEVRDDAADPIRGALDAAVRRSALGATLDEALETFVARAGTGGARALAETVSIGRAAGANLPVMLDVAADSIAEHERVARDRRAATAQARLSAGVVAVMPVAFFAVVGSGAREQLRFLFGDPIGWSLLSAGLVLETGGALWMRALLRPR